METIQETVAEKYMPDGLTTKKTMTSGKTNPNFDKAGKVAGGAAIKLMQSIAQGIYESTPGITDDLPRHTSKILQDVKQEKKPGALNLPLNKNGEIDQMNEMRYEDWQSKYKGILEEYKKEKQRTNDLLETMNDNQMRYIKREQEYKDVI